MTKNELEQITKWLEANANSSKFRNVYEMLERFKLEFNHLLKEGQIETKYNIGQEVWWKKYPNIRHGKVYGVWVEQGGISYGIIEPNGARVLYVEECLLFPTKEELLKSL